MSIAKNRGRNWPRARTSTPEQVASALVTSAGAGLSVGAGVPLAASISLGAQVLVALIGHVRGRRQRYAEKWFAGYCLGAPSDDPERVLAELQAKSEDPLVQDVIFESLRSIEDVIVADTLVPLSKLAREYASEGKRIDGFFRAVRRTLSDLTEDEYRDLRSLLESIDAIGDFPAPLIELRLTGAAVDYLRPVTDVSKNAKYEAVELGVHPHAPRLFSLLRTNGLGTDGTSGSWGARSGPGVIILERATVHRVVELCK